MQIMKKFFLAKKFIFSISLFFVGAIEAKQNILISGKWRCSSSPMLISKIKNFPKGFLTQRTAYISNSKGKWTSNSVFEYKILNSNEKILVHSTASGTHVLKNKTITESINKFRILKNKNTRNQKPLLFLKRLIMKSIRKKPRRKYFLVNFRENSYTIQPLANKGQKNMQITCNRG